MTLNRGLFLALLFAIGETPSAFGLDSYSGRPRAVYADLDTTDIVVGLDPDPANPTNYKGPCGSSFYHIQRASPIFKELTAIVLTAFSTGKTVVFYVDPQHCLPCNGPQSTTCDRNLVDHGSAWNPP
jgi:hypothetical protein